MAAANYLLTEDQFLCSICLDVFTDPVTLNCGHNFCKSCVTQHWNINVQCQCPLCKRIYNMRPELQVNTFISEMAAQFRQSAQHKSSSTEQHAAKPGDVPCDVCTGPELKALKSCLVCLTSYCETHLEPHLTKSGLKRHQLIDPVKNLEDRMCKKHDKLLELFCRSDQVCVCMMCAMLDHKTHDVVAMKEECEGKKSELVKTEAEIQQMIQKRRVKIEEIRRSVELSNEAADREMEEGVQVFTALKETVERSQAELIKTITEKQRTTKKQAEDFITELEQEISDLKKRSSEVEQLSQSEDQLHLLQKASSLITAPPDKDLRSIKVTPPPYELTKSRAVNQLEEKISKMMKQVLQDELKRIQQFTVNVTLDPDIVHPTTDELRRKYCRCVSSTEGFTSGRFYFESQVERWRPWTLGVTTQTNISGSKTLSPTNGFWTVSMMYDGGYFASAFSFSSSDLCLKSKPMKVGVFVDYEEGLVSFYDGDTAALIFSFTGCSFTGKLYPYFSPCRWEEFTEHIEEVRFCCETVKPQMFQKANKRSEGRRRDERNKEGRGRTHMHSERDVLLCTIPRSPRSPPLRSRPLPKALQPHTMSPNRPYKTLSSRFCEPPKSPPPPTLALESLDGLVPPRRDSPHRDSFIDLLESIPDPLPDISSDISTDDISTDISSDEDTGTPARFANLIPSIHRLPLYPGPGRGGSSLSKETQTSLTSDTSSSSSGGTPRRSQASQET